MIDEIDTLCQNFIAAFKEYLADWSSQRQKEGKDASSLGHDLDLAIRPQIAHLTQDSDASRAISEYLIGKMKAAPNVITYDWCPLVNKLLLDSVEKGFQTLFTVVDSEMQGRGYQVEFALCSFDT
ncbi:unnamed protein product [Strongylus vulgaris]|uniref:Uncharacterized protein n=1 Tax=Strongylus vulgaris TaxID=40348 RepID=A0A3P7IY39_STRVU|nr:unnamed protein product [Strongylus vulgaris]